MPDKDKIYKFFDNLQFFGFCLILLAVPFSLAAIESFFGVVLLSSVVKFSVRRDLHFIKTRHTALLIVYMFFLALSLFNCGAYLNIGLKAWFFKWGEYALMFLTASDTFRSRKRLITGIKVLIFSSFSVFISVITQIWMGKDILRERMLVSIAPGVNAITGSFNSHNDLGCYLSIILILLLAYFLTRHSRRTKILVGLWSVVVCAGLLFSFSRGSWFNFTVSIIFFLVMLRNVTGRVLLKAGIFWLLFMAFILSVPSLKARMLFTFSAEGDALRFSIWKSCWQMIKEHILLGRGLGTFMSYFPSFSNDFKTAYYAHNCYLQMWVESGLFSLLAFLAFTGSVLVSVWQYVKRSKDVMKAALLAGCVGFLAHSFLDTQLYSLQLSTLFWILLGMTAAEDENMAHLR
ncbi:MAG: hypothetical protein GX598_00170 [Elusimicrobia bacterium]|nr:hypothetical protein [Elusimicrobiota bacterium]